MGTGRGDSSALCTNVFVLTQSGGSFTSVAVMKTFYYFFYKFFFFSSLDKARDLLSICDVHSPPNLSLSNSGCVMELPLTAALSTSTQSLGVRSQLLVHTRRRSLGTC